MLVKHVVCGGVLFLTTQLVDLGAQLCKLVAVELLLVGQLALMSTQFGIVAAAEGVCFARLGLQLGLEVLGVPPFAGLVLLKLGWSAALNGSGMVWYGI